MTGSYPAFIEQLNEAQREAATCTEGPLLVLAGAGSGKTKVLVSRCAYLLAEKGIYPGHILALTFTNKAAGEMKERLALMTGADASRMWVGTFHSICVRILRRESDYCGYDRNFVIYDDTDQQTLLKRVIAALGYNDRDFAPRAVGAYISKQKNELRTPAGAMELVHNDWEDQAAKIYREYQRQLKANNAMDFDDLIMQTVFLFTKNPQVLEAYQDLFHYILVDEYQDTNHSQYQLVRLLAEKHHNVCAVGDPDQSIYGWRGADIRNIMDFEKDYPEAVVIKLEQNYRSTGNILNAANALIANNLERKPKDLWTQSEPGELISFQELADERAEASFIVETIYRLKSEGSYAYHDCAVCYRTHAQSRALEDMLIKYNIPYKIFGGMKFYERKEVKDILAYLRVIQNPRDDVSLLRIINEPRRSIGATSLGRLEEWAKAEGDGIYAQLDRESHLAEVGSAARKSMKQFHQMVESWRAYDDTTPVAVLMEKVITESGYRRMLEEQDTIEAQGRLENIGELLSVASSFDQEAEEGGLENFLAQISLATDMDQASDDTEYVSLMTLHTTKGLEFPVVFLAGMEERIFPHSRSLNDEPQMEEERRLCYVGITRAKEKLYLTKAKRRQLWGQTEEFRESRFVKEIPEEYLDAHRLNLYEWETDTSVVPAYQQKKGRTSLFGGEQVRTSRTGQASGVPGLLALGDKVAHAKFGTGIVVQVKGSGEDMEVTVAFPDQGLKNLIVKYAPIKKIG